MFGSLSLFLALRGLGGYVRSGGGLGLSRASALSMFRVMKHSTALCVYCLNNMNQARYS